MSDNQKIYIAKGIYLEFKEEANGKYSFSSNDPDVQNWCENVKTKQVKGKDIKFVADAAKKYKSEEKNNAPKKVENVQQQRCFSTKLSGNFSVQPKDCGDWNKDAVSALQIFCQKNKIVLPKYTKIGTSQGYVTQTSITLKLGDVEITKSASTKQEAKQECARAFKKNVLDKPAKNKEVEKTCTTKSHSEPDPSLFKGWKKNPYLTLEKYCNHYNIELNVDADVSVLTVGKETFQLYNHDYDKLSDGEIKDDLAKYYYKCKIEPILQKKLEQVSDNTSANDLCNFPVPNMVEYEGKDNLVWTRILNELCAKAHLPLPQFVEAAIVKDGTERKCPFPQKFNLKGWREDETRVMYLKMPGIDGKIRGEGKQFQDAQYDSAKNCLYLIWYDNRIADAQKKGKDKLVDFYKDQKEKLEKKCKVGSFIQEARESHPEINDFDQRIKLLKDKFNSGRK